jgi:hypothetical protein
VRRESKQEREAWTNFIEGGEAKENKYSVSPKDERGKYASKYEATVAQNLDALFRAGEIVDLSEQVPFTLVEGKGKIRPIKYIADFVYFDLAGVRHVCDAKGCKTPVYRLKRKLMFLLHGITVEEL